MLFLAGCSSSPDPIQTSSSARHGMQHVYQEWKGTPYRLGGTTKRGIDCSAFTQVAMRDVYQVNLPRTTEQLAQQGSKVSRSNAAYGDLVFFKTGWRTRHVGIYVGNNQFMHASTSKGVIISSLDNVYWKSKFWQIRRVL
ncbi:MAG: NlpC/P60 family protein [Vibrio sp.]